MLRVLETGKRRTGAGMVSQSKAWWWGGRGGSDGEEAGNVPVGYIVEGAGDIVTGE